MAETLVAHVSMTINAPQYILVSDVAVRPIFRASKAVRSSERGNATEREPAHSEGGWRLALGNLKALLEGTSIVPMR